MNKIFLFAILVLSPVASFAQQAVQTDEDSSRDMQWAHSYAQRLKSFEQTKSVQVTFTNGSEQNNASETIELSKEEVEHYYRKIALLTISLSKCYSLKRSQSAKDYLNSMQNINLSYLVAKAMACASEAQIQDTFEFEGKTYDTRRDYSIDRKGQGPACLPNGEADLN